MLFCLMFCFAACKRAKQPGTRPFDNLKLGMSLEEATKLAGSEGKPCEHDKLPFSLLPRDGYKGLPEKAAYLIWWNEKTGIPELTLGVLDGRVIYKDVEWDENGQRKGERNALPEYQR